MTDGILSETRSLCPECFERVPAFRVAYGSQVFLEKRCNTHGNFKTIIWRGSPALQQWSRPKIPSTPAGCFTETEKGCPFDCGLCTAHGQHTCTALLEITGRCNLRCPVCFAQSGGSSGTSTGNSSTGNSSTGNSSTGNSSTGNSSTGNSSTGNSSTGGYSKPDPDMAKIRFWYERVKMAGPNCNIQLSGGEPTLRDDLPEIITLGKKTGFDFIQLNTNGLRLAREKGLAKKLKSAGLSSVFLQFDGTEDSIYQAIRGAALLEEKLMAIANCADANIGVVLVPTLVPGVNTRRIGEIIRFGLKHSPQIRGVHFQPVSYFGRYPAPPSDRDRITIPEILTAIEKQTEGMIDAVHFKPPGCEHSLCSFHGNFMVMPDETLKPLTGEEEKTCCPAPVKAEIGARQAIFSVKRQWAAPAPVCGKGPEPEDDLDLFLSRAKTHLFTISGMAFQDAWNLDLERLKGCCIHTVSPDGRLIPFCAYNVTTRQGQSLYRD